jgi:glycine dehydrogenase subunit 1
MKISGVEPLNSQPFFREFAFKVPGSASEVLSHMATNGVLGGLSIQALHDDATGEADNVILVTVTEKRTKDQIDNYVELLRKAVA